MASRHYNRKWWKQARKRILERDGLCQSCLIKGRTRAAVDIDHKTPWKKTGNFFVDDDGLQGLCRSCHSLKTGRGEKTLQQIIKEKTKAVWR